MRENMKQKYPFLHKTAEILSEAWQIARSLTLVSLVFVNLRKEQNMSQSQLAKLTGNRQQAL